MKIGFIGLGSVGSGMAMNLLKAGHDVTVYNRTRAKAEALIAKGANVAALTLVGAKPSTPCSPMTMRLRAWCSTAMACSQVLAKTRSTFSSTISVALSKRLTEV